LFLCSSNTSSFVELTLKGDAAALLNPSFIDRSEMSAHRSYSQTKPSQAIPSIREEVLAVRKTNEQPVKTAY